MNVINVPCPCILTEASEHGYFSGTSGTVASGH